MTRDNTIFICKCILRNQWTEIWTKRRETKGLGWALSLHFSAEYVNGIDSIRQATVQASTLAVT